MYVNISIHDYLRALMGFHQYDTNFTLDPRVAMTEHRNVSRGIGNQVTVEFNLLYRFHCAISQNDESFAEDFIKEMHIDYLENKERGELETKKQDKATKANQDEATQEYREWDHSKRHKEAMRPEVASWDPKALSLNQFIDLMRGSRKPPKKPWEREFGLKDKEQFCFQRNSFTGLFDDEKMISQLWKSMDDPICRLFSRSLCSSLMSVPQRILVHAMCPRSSETWS